MYDSLERSRLNLSNLKMDFEEQKKLLDEKAQSLQTSEEECSMLESELSFAQVLKERAAEIGRFYREYQLIKADISNLERDAAESGGSLDSIDALKEELAKIKQARSEICVQC